MKNLNENQVLILNYMNEAQKKLSFSDLKKQFNIKGQDEITSFYNDINDLRLKGEIWLSDDYYQIFPKNVGLYQGTITINESGRGYVKIGKQKIFVPHEKLNGALDEDVVVLKEIHKEKGRVIAEVINIVKRNSDTLVCELTNDRNLKPVRSKYNISLSFIDDGSLVVGDRVKVKLEEKVDGSYPVKIERYIGHADDLNIELTTIAEEYGFYNELSEGAQKQLETIPNEVLDKDTDGRVDLTHEQIFSIDGINTKDRDDAVSIAKLDNGNFLLKVHISDVEHYVPVGSPLYHYALDRGTSLYLVNGVIPMLPHKLSNGICSLDEKVLRLTNTCEMEIDKETAEVVNFNVYKSVIKSGKQMNYEDVNKILEHNVIPEGYESFIDDLRLFKEFSDVYDERRKKRKALSFDSKEIEVVMDENTPTGFGIKKRGPAEKMIENAMVSANETVATMLYYMNVPSIYRVHDIPDINTFNESLSELKKLYMFKKYANFMTLNSIDKLLDKAKDSEDYDIISSLILRQLKRAKYTYEVGAHYGLGLRYYTHFTSPIRRSPDLIINGLLNRFLYEHNYEDLDILEKDIAEAAYHASQRERQADKAEMEANLFEMAKYLQIHLDELRDQNIEAKIKDLDNYYSSVRLHNGITGKLDLSDKKFSYNKDGRFITAKYPSGKVHYHLGDKIKVHLEDVNVKDREIIFSLEGLLQDEVLDPIPLLEPFDKTKTMKRH